MSNVSLGPLGQHVHPDLLRHRPILRPQTIAVAPGVWCIHGLSLSNSHVLETRQGLIVVDTGSGRKEGEAILQRIRQVSQRPIVAVLYTHHHYVHGTSAVLADSPAGARIIGHPLIAQAVAQRLSVLGPGHSRRVAWEAGLGLPASGPDAVLEPAPNHGGGGSCYLPPTESAGEVQTELEIDGIRVIAAPGPFDTTDGVFWRFVEHNAVAHNLVTQGLPNCGSIAGGSYRDVLPWFAAIDQILKEVPAVLLPCHGGPLVGKNHIRERLEANRDVLQFLYDQVVRGINQGRSLPQILDGFGLPSPLATRADLQGHYGSLPHQVRAIYHGLIGFWNGEADALDPLLPREEAQCLAEELGGVSGLIFRAEQAMKKGNIRWAAKLAGAAILMEPGNPLARSLRAQTLRQQGYNASAWTQRNAVLSHACLCDGTLDKRRCEPRFDAVAAASAPSLLLVSLLRYRVNPQGAQNTQICLHFTDTDEYFVLALRNAVLRVEVCQDTKSLPLATSTRERWIQTLANQAPWTDLATWPTEAGALLGALDGVSE